MRSSWIVTSIVVTACGGGGARDERSPVPVPGTDPPAAAARVALGECAGADARFVSGRRSAADPDPLRRSTPVGAGRRGTGAPGGTSVRLAQPSVRGDLDPAIVRRYVKRSLAPIQACYDAGRAADPGLAGEVRVELVIAGDGRVTSSTHDGGAAEVAGCMADVLAAIHFPAPRGRVEVTASVTVAFGAPEAADAAAPTAAAAPIAARDSLLRDRADAIAACIPAASHGAAVVDLSVDGAGAAAVGGVHGLDGGVAACVTTAAAGVVPPGTSPGAYRCAFAYGTLAAADAPGLDVTAANLVHDGTVLAFGRIVDDPELRATIPELAERLAASPAVGDGVIAVDGPLVVRVSDDAPMVAVDRVLATVGAADRGAVLAAHRDGAWTVLRGLALPLAPVAGTDGGRWFDGKPRARDTDPDGEERVVASILIASDAVWLVQSRINEVVRVDVTPAGHDWAALERALGEAKRSAFLRDRVDVEIGADPEIRFGEVVKAIELAAAAGFSEWRVVAPAALAGQPHR